MQATDYQAFVAMYQALDAAYDEDHNKKVLAFISDANPNIWKGRTSGDPAVFAEFADGFAARFPGGKAQPKDAMAFVRIYLTGQNDEYDWEEGDLVAAFDSVVTSDLWEQALAAAPE